MLLLFVLALAMPAGAQRFALTNVNIQTCFTPGEDCTDQIVEEIGHAKSEILVQAYSFTSLAIAQALVDASGRGVKVQAILDKSQRSERYTSAQYLANARIPIYIDDRHGIAHNKIIVIDRSVTITGSFNFTKAAQERNAENLLVIRSSEIARTYLENWHVHKGHSEVYQARY